ncbi:hypothetical protein HPB50_006497 [Hyalomma asiaticum]|uniref:Uncharacterized protein n=1 Tax=Hyalomma asiaticum TaxID=266040 RepID=A0ACB7TDU0_HYAAI|nr:hypothetical protein HPB50_006497 [Hyalomma asiaticum]
MWHLLRCVFFSRRLGEQHRSQGASRCVLRAAATREDCRPIHAPHGNVSMRGTDSTQPKEDDFYSDICKFVHLEASSSLTRSLHECTALGFLLCYVQVGRHVCIISQEDQWRLMRISDVTDPQRPCIAAQQAKGIQSQPPRYPCNSSTYHAVSSNQQASNRTSHQRLQDITQILRRPAILNGVSSMPERMHDRISRQITELELDAACFLARMVETLRQAGYETSSVSGDALPVSFVDQLNEEYGRVLSTQATKPLPASQTPKFAPLLRSLKTRDPEKQKPFFKLAFATALHVVALIRTIVQREAVAGEKPIGLGATTCVPSVETIDEGQEVASLECLLFDKHAGGEQVSGLVHGGACSGKVGVIA